MGETQGRWLLKTLSLVVVAAALTAVLSEVIQTLVWHKSNTGISGGAAAGVGVAVAVSARRRRQPDQPDQPAP